MPCCDAAKPLGRTDSGTVWRAAYSRRMEGFSRPKPIPGMPDRGTRRKWQKMLHLPDSAMNWFVLKPFSAVACRSLAAGRPASVLPNSPEFFTPAKKIAELLSATVGPAGIRFTHDSECRPFEESANRPSQARTSLLASIHKKTLAGFSDYPEDSIAPAALSLARRLRGSRARSSELAVQFVFILLVLCPQQQRRALVRMRTSSYAAAK
jgi:hypothetical protein